MNKKIKVILIIPFLAFLSSCDKERHSKHNSNDSSTSTSNLDPSHISLSMSNYTRYFDVKTYCSYYNSIYYYQFLEIKGVLSTAIYTAKFTYCVKDDGTYSEYDAEVNAAGNFLSPGIHHTAEVKIVDVSGNVEILRNV